jgi:hypothetical protein
VCAFDLPKPKLNPWSFGPDEAALTIAWCPTRDAFDPTAKSDEQWKLEWVEQRKKDKESKRSAREYEKMMKEVEKAECDEEEWTDDDDDDDVEEEEEDESSSSDEYKIDSRVGLWPTGGYPLQAYTNYRFSFNFCFS